MAGDPKQEVRRILLAVDPVQAVADEAVRHGAELLIVHHPLFLRGTSTVAADTPKGRVVHDLIGSGCGLLTAHTNADSPAGGVSESLALRLGMTDLRPIEADPAEPRDKIVVFVPTRDADQVRDALAEAGAGSIGDYDSCSFSSSGIGRFRPLSGAQPTIGRVGVHEQVPEVRIEVEAARRLRDSVIAAMIAAHPYEEPAYDVIELADAPSADRGSGRIGRLIEPVSLAQFATNIALALPQTAHGVRVAGDRDRLVEQVAVCGGAGDFLLDSVHAAGVDAYVTSDLRHHPASELQERAGAPALIDVAHWAAEWTWLPRLAERLTAELGAGVEVTVSEICTDPWTFQA